VNPKKRSAKRGNFGKVNRQRGKEEEVELFSILEAA